MRILLKYYAPFDYGVRHRHQMRLCKHFPQGFPCSIGIMQEDEIDSKLRDSFRLGDQVGLRNVLFKVPPGQLCSPTQQYDEGMWQRLKSERCFFEDEETNIQRATYFQ